MARPAFKGSASDSLACPTELEYTTTGEHQNLDNEISALPSVQVTREFVATNGCRVTLNFASQSRPDIRIDIAKLLINVFENNRRNDNEEASSLPVQSLNKTAG